MDLEHFCSHFNASSINSIQCISLFALRVGELIKGDLLLTATFVSFLLTKTGPDFDVSR